MNVSTLSNFSSSKVSLLQEENEDQQNDLEDQIAFFDMFLPRMSKNKRSSHQKTKTRPDLDIAFLKGNRLEDKWYYKIAKLLSVFLREILLFYTIIYFLQTPNVFKVLYLGSYLHYFVSQISDLRRLVVRYKLKPLIEAKIRYFRNCLVESLEADRRTTLTDDQELRSAERQMHRVYVHLFSKSIFNAVHQCTKRTWLLLFLTILFYLQVLFLVKLFMVHVENLFWVEFLFNFDFEDEKLLKEELAKVIFVLVITVFELYFMNILKSQPLTDQESLIHSILAVVVDFYEFRALVKEKEKQREKQSAQVMENKIKNENSETEKSSESEKIEEPKKEDELQSPLKKIEKHKKKIKEFFNNYRDLPKEKEEPIQDKFDFEFEEKLLKYERNIKLSFEKYKRFADEKMAVQLQELFLEDSMSFDSISQPFSSLISK